MKQESELAKQASECPGPKLDLSFKEGQTIKINIGVSVESTLDDGDRWKLWVFQLNQGATSYRVSESAVLRHRTSRRKTQVGPKLGPRAGVSFLLHLGQRLGALSPLLGDSRQSQWHRPMLVIILPFSRMDSKNAHLKVFIFNPPSFNPAPLLDFGPPVAAAQPSTDMWGDFTSAAST